METLRNRYRYPLGNIRVMLGLYGDNGKENGNYYNGLHFRHESLSGPESCARRPDSAKLPTILTENQTPLEMIKLDFLRNYQTRQSESISQN